MDEVEDMDFHITHPVVSISVEMSQHLSFLHIMCYLVEVPLEPLFQTVLGLADVLFPASCAGYTLTLAAGTAQEVIQHSTHAPQIAVNSKQLIHIPWCRAFFKMMVRSS